MNFCCESVAAFDYIEKLLLILSEIVKLADEVLEDLVGATDANERGDIVEGRVAGKQVRAGRSQKLPVRSFERHGGGSWKVLLVSTGDR